MTRDFDREAADMMRLYREHKQRAAAGENVVNIKGWVVGELVDAIQSCLDNGLTPEEILGLLDEAILETVEENS